MSTEMMEIKKGMIVEILIHDTAEKNRCIGQLENGMRMFVEGPTAVGDTVRARVTKIKKRYAVAALTEIVRPSDRRTDPRCVHFGTCGGCKWQHLEYEEQLRIKRKQVVDALVHLGGFDDPTVHTCRPSDTTYGYRNKIDMDFTDRRYLTQEELDLPDDALSKPADFALGFHAPGCFAKAIDIDVCHLASPEMNTAVQTVRRFFLECRPSIYSTFTHEGWLRNLVVRQGGHTGELMVYLITSPPRDESLLQKLESALRAELGDRLTTLVHGVTERKNRVACSDDIHPLSGNGTIRDQIGDVTYRISPDSFFQTHTRQAEALYTEILKAAQLGGNETVLDLFCGTGSIGLFVARRCKRVLGLELDPGSVADAIENARRNRIDNCTFRQLDLIRAQDLRRELDAFGHPDVVITDPPRAGMHPKALQTLIDLTPPAVVYVSCNPASLARDGQILCQDGRYRLTAVQPVDLFPQTNHIESVARFERAPV